METHKSCKQIARSPPDPPGRWYLGDSGAKEAPIVFFGAGGVDEAVQGSGLDLKP